MSSHSGTQAHSPGYTAETPSKAKEAASMDDFRGIHHAAACRRECVTEKPTKDYTHISELQEQLPVSKINAIIDLINAACSMQLNYVKQ